MNQEQQNKLKEIASNFEKEAKYLSMLPSIDSLKYSKRKFKELILLLEDLEFKIELSNNFETPEV